MKISDYIKSFYARLRHIADDTTDSDIELVTTKLYALYNPSVAQREDYAKSIAADCYEITDSYVELIDALRAKFDIIYPIAKQTDMQIDIDGETFYEVNSIDLTRLIARELDEAYLAIKNAEESEANNEIKAAFVQLLDMADEVRAFQLKTYNKIIADYELPLSF